VIAHTWIFQEPAEKKREESDLIKVGVKQITNLYVNTKTLN